MREKPTPVSVTRTLSTGISFASVIAPATRPTGAGDTVFGPFGAARCCDLLWLDGAVCAARWEARPSFLSKSPTGPTSFPASRSRLKSTGTDSFMASITVLPVVLKPLTVALSV